MATPFNPQPLRALALCMHDNSLYPLVDSLKPGTQIQYIRRQRTHERRGLHNKTLIFESQEVLIAANPNLTPSQKLIELLQIIYNQNVELDLHRFSESTFLNSRTVQLIFCGEYSYHDNTELSWEHSILLVTLVFSRISGEIQSVYLTDQRLSTRDIYPVAVYPQE